MKAVHILTDFFAKAGEGSDLTRQNQFSDNALHIDPECFS